MTTTPVRKPRAPRKPAQPKAVTVDAAKVRAVVDATAAQGFSAGLDLAVGLNDDELAALATFFEQPTNAPTVAVELPAATTKPSPAPKPTPPASAPLGPAQLAALAGPTLQMRKPATLIANKERKTPTTTVWLGLRVALDLADAAAIETIATDTDQAVVREAVRQWFTDHNTTLPSTGWQVSFDGRNWKLPHNPADATACVFLITALEVALPTMVAPPAQPTPPAIPVPPIPQAPRWPMPEPRPNSDPAPWQAPRLPWRTPPGGGTGDPPQWPNPNGPRWQHNPHEVTSGDLPATLAQGWQAAPPAQFNPAAPHIPITDADRELSQWYDRHVEDLVAINGLDTVPLPHGVTFAQAQAEATTARAELARLPKDAKGRPLPLAEPHNEAELELLETLSTLRDNKSAAFNLDPNSEAAAFLRWVGEAQTRINTAELARNRALETRSRAQARNGGDFGTGIRPGSTASALDVANGIA